MNKKKLIIIMFLISIFNIIISNFTFAAENINYMVKYNKNENRYISYNSTSQRFFDYYYINELNEKLDTYCVNLDQDGAEKTEDGYVVNANEYINDQNIINMINNGYPHKTYQELGLEDENQAKFATQFAIWIYTNNLDISKIGNINDKSDLVKQAIINIYNSKSITRDLDTNFEIIEKETEIISVESKDYYKIKYILNVGKDILDIKEHNNDKNIKIVDSKLKIIDSIKDKKEFYILYPVDLVKNNINIELKFIVKYKNLKVKLGKPIDNKMQDVALILPEYEEEQIIRELKIEYKKLELEINKVDTEDNPIKNVKFKIFNNETNKLIGEYLTDKNGNINIDFRKELNIHDDISLRIEEIKTAEGYELLKTPVFVKLEYGKCLKVYIENIKIPEKIEEPKEEEKPKEDIVELPKTGM